MYNHNNNNNYHHQTIHSKANPGGFIAPNSINPVGGFINPNTTNPGGFHVPTQPIYDKHRNSILSQYPSPYHPPPLTSEDNRRDSISIKQHNNHLDNSNNINNIVQSPINITPYPPYNGYPPSQKQTFNQITNPADLQRRFYGICKACGVPNSDFAECSTCKNWLIQMETMIKERRSLIDQQLCTKCQLPNHVHGQIAACAKCGFPKSCLKELNKVAIKKENKNDDDDSNNSNNNNDEKIGLICGNCNNPLENYLKCPTYLEIAQRMRKERECLPYEDPNFAKLSKIIKQYSDLAKQNS
ncbi:hypothetical protein RclHR1_06380002 [Rhizophagus clarus]|uniref:Uncharacterized protein n=1 Tax=Rhizophagus clarus TaxID=94130 RepID=A0A2Z6RTY0_9GLOM|nr:hypothetical protein RclHR1_06380002 [Rhizophagus clarus]GES92143.1 hypothetical protein GLOIN_2v1874895 [Rhizophagus clarus]